MTGVFPNLIKRGSSLLTSPGDSKVQSPASKKIAHRAEATMSRGDIPEAVCDGQRHSFSMPSHEIARISTYSMAGGGKRGYLSDRLPRTIQIHGGEAQNELYVAIHVRRHAAHMLLACKPCSGSAGSQGPVPLARSLIRLYV